MKKLLDEQLDSLLECLVGDVLEDKAVDLGLYKNQIKDLFEYEELQPLEVRREKFIEEVRPYVEEMGKEEANSFCRYWLSKTPKGRKFRFEKEKVFSVPQRISTWMRNSKKFSVVNMLNRK